MDREEESKKRFESLKFGIKHEVIGDLGKYGGLMTGVYFAAKDEPNILGVVIGGIAYGAFSLLGRVSNAIRAGAIADEQNAVLEERLKDQ